MVDYRSFFHSARSESKQAISKISLEMENRLRQRINARDKLLQVIISHKDLINPERIRVGLYRSYNRSEGLIVLQKITYDGIFIDCSDQPIGVG